VHALLGTTRSITRHSNKTLQRFKAALQLSQAARSIKHPAAAQRQ
jgi:hypothetical protein